MPIRVRRGELISGPRIKVHEVESGTHRGAQERRSAAGEQPRSLPDAGGNQHLWALAGCQIRAQVHNAPTTVGKQLQLLDRVAEVEVKQFIARQAVHAREARWRDEVVDGGGRRFVAGASRAAICLPKPAAFHR